MEDNNLTAETKMTEKSPNFFSEKISVELAQEVGLEDLPILLSVLDNKDKRGSLPQTLHSLLGSILQLIPVAEVEQRLLQFVLPATKNFFLEIILEISSSLKNVELQNSENFVDVLHENLQIGLDLLESVNSLLIHLSSLGKIKVSHVLSVPMNVNEILLETFRHCQNSENEYGKMLSLMRDKLIGFFQKGHQIQISYLSLLHDNLVFVCNYEDDLELLTKVMEYLSSIGEAVEGLDVKSMVDQWKGYTRLAETYAIYLRQTLNVAQPISFLCNNIVSHLGKLFTENGKEDYKKVRRRVKISSLELKVVIKLCEFYHDYLGDCQHQLLNLLLHLKMCLPSYLEYKKVSSPIADEMGEQLFVGACPLLSHLISDKEFIRVYVGFIKELQSTTQEIKLGFLLLTISITKKIVRIDEEVQELWLQSETIVIIILASLHYCQDALCLDVIIEGDKTVDIYEALLINTTVLICNVLKSSDFPRLEDLLISQLMKPYFWPATFVSDIIVLICRFGTSELCFNLTQQMCEVTLQWNKDKFCPEWIYITQTTGRLFTLLTTSAKLNLLCKYPPSQHLTLWKHLSFTELPLEEQKSWYLDLIQKANADIHHFTNVSSDIGSYKSMVDSLSVVDKVTFLSDIHIDVCSTLARNVFYLWQYLSIPTNMNSLETSVNGLQWFYNLFSTLIAASVPLLAIFNNNQLSFILQCVSDICKTGASFCRLVAIQLLQGLATTKLVKDQEQYNLFQKISSLFAALLNDNDPVIKTMSLQTFEYFSSLTTHVVIVSETVVGDKELQKLVKQFLQRLSITNTSVIDENFFFSQKNIFKHKCKAMQMLSQLDMSIASTNLCVLENSAASLALQSILKDSVFLNEHFRENEATTSEETLLKNVFEEINKLKHSVHIENEC